jgi:hypothetical protein
VTIFLGIANYIGEQRGVQDKRGSVLSTANLSFHRFTCQLTTPIN